MFVFSVDHSQLQQNTIINKGAALFLFATTVLFGCESSRPSRFLYPAEKEMEVRYLCRLPYLDATASHQAWAKSTPALLIVSETKVIVYFNNDSTFVFDRTSDITLPSGKYRCTL
jgi:hypothetical protein